MNAASAKPTFVVVIGTIHGQKETVDVKADSMHINEAGTLMFRTGQQTICAFAAGVWREATQNPPTAAHE